MNFSIALFGEAEKGSFQSLIHLNTISQLVDYLGNPPQESIGIGLAVQTLMFRKDVIYIRVHEEGFSFQDYYQGLHLLHNHLPNCQLQAICMPGVGDYDLIEQAQNSCNKFNCLLMMNEQDLYDYLTN